MSDEPDLYKREEDKRWRQRVDHQQITLLTGHQVLRDKLDDLARKLDEQDRTLRGDKGRGGLIAEYDRHDDKLTKLYAVIFQDSTGTKGLIHDVDYLMGRKKRSDSVWENGWKFFTAVAVALVSAAALVLTNIDRIKKALYPTKPNPIHEMIEHAKHPKGRHIHVKPIVVEDPEPDPSD